HQPPNHLAQTSSRLILRWNHEPGPRLTPRWTRLVLALPSTWHQTVSLMFARGGSMTTFSAEQFKAATRQAWEKSAGGWNSQTRHIHEWLAEATEAMLDSAHITSGMRVLDIAAGAGDQTLDIAQRVGPNGHVLATDISETILQFAKDYAQRAGLLNVETGVADADGF